MVAVMIALLTLTVFEVWEHRPFSVDGPGLNFQVEIILVTLALIFFLILGFHLSLSSVRGSGRFNFNRRGGATKKQGEGQRVLVVQNESLLGAGIESLLNRDTGLDIQGIQAEDEAALVKQIKLNEPDVIIIDEHESFVDSVHILTLFDHSPNLRVIGVSTENGMVRVYDKNQFTITRPEEFARVVTDDSEL